MEYKFEYVILNRETVNEFIWVLHKPEPSGYGALPPKSMNTAYGVAETSTGIILTCGYEEDSREWRGKEGDHFIQFDVKCKEGCFYAKFDTNAYWDYWESARIYSPTGSREFYKYTDIVRKAIHFYMKNGDAYKIFSEKFEKENGEPIYKYKDRTYKEIYYEWKRKWE